jgi:type I restriction-modification system DNA methylase subunit
MNERKIETQVYKHFDNQLNNSGIIEEQISDNPRVMSLLKGASKSSGNGIGRPEHIISFKSYYDLLIITECKGDKKLHESTNLEINPQKYAVDGVKHYSNFLSKEFDVLSIAISGENMDDCKITHFFQKKGTDYSGKILGDKLLSLDSYFNFYTKNELTVNQDYEKLKNFANELNTKLHSNKILESQRSLLLSAILVALDNESFKNSYKYISDGNQLSSSLVQTVFEFLDKKADLSKGQLELVQSHFSFIKTDTTLSSSDFILRDIINDIEKNIKTFIDTYNFRDVLGEIYNVFLSYSNSDKGLGIVLTPPHITELFSELSQVNKKSIVLDTCTGTGGFLISALKYMIKDCNGDESLINSVRENQIIGVEYQSHIYALLVSNLLIHNSKVKNILSGSCFDGQNINFTKSKKPNIGMLNPPFKGDKKTDTEELEFVYNNLECLEIGGTCVAILPMSCAVRGDDKIKLIREKILKSHSLEGVLSMPDELFYNSNAGVVSCIMIFTAHKSHNPNKEVYFGYYKNDGFVKRKNLGRVDYFNRWDKIKEKWVSNFLNRKVELGFSTCEKIDFHSEWSVENYLKTNYQKLKKNDFEKMLHVYSSYLFGNSKINIATSEPIIDNNLDLFDREWKIFNLSNIFDITGTKTTKPDIVNNSKQGEYPYITTQATNNGVEKFLDFFTEVGNVLTVDSAVLGYTSYQHDNFTASDHVEQLVPKFESNPFIMMFLVTILNMEQYRFNYGRKASQTRLKSLDVTLPVNFDGEIDFEFMTSYVQSCKFSSNILKYVS